MKCILKMLLVILSFYAFADNVDINKKNNNELDSILLQVGEWRDKLNNKHPGWNEILKKSEKTAGVKGRLANRGINVN